MLEECEAMECKQAGADMVGPLSEGECEVHGRCIHIYKDSQDLLCRQ
jgi:hypothetical protein